MSRTTKTAEHCYQLCIQTSQCRQQRPDAMKTVTYTVQTFKTGTVFRRLTDALWPSHNKSTQVTKQSTTDSSSRVSK